jgi:hypothetical protein
MAPQVFQHPGARTTRRNLVIKRSVRAGDPFLQAASRRPNPDEEAPHGCIDGWVYLGFEGEDVNGEHVEEIERVPCKRCRA